MTSRKRQCPRHARLHRHCLDSLDIPLSLPACQVPHPSCQEPPPVYQTQLRDCQGSPFANHVRPLTCQRPDQACQVQPTACEVEPPTNKFELPACQLKPRLFRESSPSCQIRRPVCQVKPACHCKVPPCNLFQPFACQIDPPTCELSSTDHQLPPLTCEDQSPCAIERSICQYLDFCTADNCPNSTNCLQSQSPICQRLADENDNIIYSDCIGPCTQSKGGFENMGQNDNDQPNSSNRSNKNNQQGKSNEEDLIRTPVTYSKATPKTYQNAYTMPSYSADEENTDKTQIMPCEDGMKSHQNKYFSGVAGSANREIISNEFNEMPVSEDNSPQLTDNIDDSKLWKTIPCCQPGFFQEQAFQPILQENDGSEQSNSKEEDFIRQNDCDASDDKSATIYRTRPNVDSNEYQENQTEPSKALHSQYEQFNTDDNIKIDNFKRNSCCNTREKLGASQSPRPALKNPSNRHSRSDSKVHLQEPSDGTCLDCSTCCDISGSTSNNIVQARSINRHQENVAPDHGTDSRLRLERANSSKHCVHQNAFENSVPMRKPKQFAGCCKRGISKILEPTEPPDYGEEEACVQEVGSTSCASATCVANNITSDCKCKYPPAFKQFSCAGNINGTCNCSDNSKKL